MPEGDTILGAALRLRRALVGRRLDQVTGRVDDTRLDMLVGQTVREIESRGKHLLIHAGELTIHTHLGMSGAWHIVREGELWTKPQHRAGLVLRSPPVVAICFSPKTLEILTTHELRRHLRLQNLGPDVLGGDFSVADVLARLRKRPDRPLGEALLDQEVVSGIGNVYKSEILYRERIDPFAPVGSIPESQLASLLERVAALMLRNVGVVKRRTREGMDGRYGVYRRVGEPCLVCGTVIQMRRQGPLARSTYFCPSCQCSRHPGAPG